MSNSKNHGSVLDYYCLIHTNTNNTKMKKLVLIALIFMCKIFCVSSTNIQCLKQVLNLLDHDAYKNKLIVFDRRYIENSMLPYDKQPVIMFDIQEKIVDFIPIGINLFVFIIDDVKQFQEYLRKYYSHMTVKSPSIIFMFYGNVSDLELLFKSSYQKGLYNVLVITTEWKIFMYYPLSKGNCSYIPFEYLDKCKKIAKDPLYKMPIKFPQNCSKAASFINLPPFTYDKNFKDKEGYEIKILKTLNDHSNFSVKILQSTQIHIRFGIPIIGDTNYDFIYYQSTNDIAFFVTKSKKKELWKNIVTIFNVNTWISLLFSIIFMIFLISIVEDLKIDSSILLVWAALLNCSHKYPEKLKTLFLIWSTLALIITSSFSGLLIGILCKTAMEKQITTVQEAMEAGYTLAEIDASFYQCVTGMYKNCKFCYYASLIEVCYNEVINGNTLLLANTKTIRYVQFNNYRPLYKRVVLSGACSSMEVHKGSVFQMPLQDILTLMSETGIIQHLDIYQWKDVPDETPADHEIMTLKHLKLFFFVLAIGILFASCVFIIEILWPKN